MIFAALTDNGQLGFTEPEGTSVIETFSFNGGIIQHRHHLDGRTESRSFIDGDWSAWELFGGVGGANITDETLVSWTQAEAWSVQSVTRDSNGIVESAAVVWPDGSLGNFNTLEADEEWLAVDSYSVSHSLSGKVAVQPPVVRDSSTGQVAEQPAMQVQP